MNKSRRCCYFLALKESFYTGLTPGNDGFVSDCYAVCKYDNTHILFYSYTDFPLIKLNTQTFDCESYKTPCDFVGSHSMVCKRSHALF